MFGSMFSNNRSQSQPNQLTGVFVHAIENRAVRSVKVCAYNCSVAVQLYGNIKAPPKGTWTISGVGGEAGQIDLSLSPSFYLYICSNVHYIVLDQSKINERDYDQYFVLDNVNGGRITLGDGLRYEFATNQIIFCR